MALHATAAVGHWGWTSSHVYLVTMTCAIHVPWVAHRCRHTQHAPTLAVSPPPSLNSQSMSVRVLCGGRARPNRGVQRKVLLRQGRGRKASKLPRNPGQRRPQRQGWLRCRVRGHGRRDSAESVLEREARTPVHRGAPAATGAKQSGIHWEGRGSICAEQELPWEASSDPYECM